MRSTFAGSGTRWLCALLLGGALAWSSVSSAEEAAAEVDEEGTWEDAPSGDEEAGDPATDPTEPSEDGDEDEAAAAKTDDLPKCEVGKDVEAKGTEDAPTAESSAAAASAADEEKEIRAMFRDAVDRYARAAHDYQGEVHRVLQRSVDKQKDFIENTYGKQGEDLEGEERQRREEAIRRFERFIQQYPDNEEYTPDAMFRLAELYFENSEVRFIDSEEQYDKDRRLYDRGKIPMEPRIQDRVMDDSIRIYRTLLARFGNSYRYADAVYYLLGYVQSEAAENEEALRAWETLVKRFPDSDFAPETYLRIGEEYFDMGEFDLAGRYYKKAMGEKSSGYYDKALYKLGWTYFQLYDYHKAINGFLELISYYDEKEAIDGPSATGSALREEAVEYLALSLAEDDWDNDGLPDADAGVKRALSYLSSGRPYERDIVVRYSKALVDLADEKKWREAIVVLRYLVDQDGLAANAPALQDEITRLYDVLRETEKAYATRQEFARLFGPESSWWEANKAEQKQRQHIIQSIMDSRLERAMYLDQKGRGLLTEAKMELNADKLAQAQMLFREAADAYADFIKDYPGYEDNYDLIMYRAEALWNSGQYAIAGPAYEAIAKMPGEGEYLSIAAWKWIKSRERIMTELVQAGALDPKLLPGSEWEPEDPEEEPEEEEGGGDVEKEPEQNLDLVAEDVPESALKWVSAVDFFLLNNVQIEGQSDAGVNLAYQVGEMMYRLNRLEEARTWFKQVISCYPKHEAAADAVAQIINSYFQVKDFDNLEKWGNLAEQLNLGDPEQMASTRKAIRMFKLGGQYRKADTLMQQEKFLEAAREFERLADENPDITYADKVYFNAAAAYQKVKYYDSAATLLERLVTEERFNKSEFIEKSLSVLAETYKQFFSFDKAISAFRTLHGRYREAERDERKYRLGEIAKLYEAAGNYREAAQAYEAYVAAYPSDDIAATYLKTVGDLYERLDDVKNTRRILRQFIKKYDKNQGEYKRPLDEWVMESHGKLRDIALRVGDKRATKRIEDQIVKEYLARNEAPEGTLSWYGELNTKPAELVAGIMFRRLEREWRRYKNIRITSGKPKQITKIIQDKLKARQELEKKLFGLMPYNSLDWTIAVAYRAAQLYDDFAEMLLNIPEPQGLSDEELEEYEVMIEDLATPIEDKAIELYEKAVLQARKFKVKNQWARRALESINKYKPNEYPIFRELKTETVSESLYTLDVRAPEGSQ